MGRIDKRSKQLMKSKEQFILEQRLKIAQGSLENAVAAVDRCKAWLNTDDHCEELLHDMICVIIQSHDEIQTIEQQLKEIKIPVYRIICPECLRMQIHQNLGINPNCVFCKHELTFEHVEEL